jgi:murein DD-endopeptidase MepM/ murein hydrolase activator NlpD
MPKRFILVLLCAVFLAGAFMQAAADDPMSILQQHDPTQNSRTDAPATSQTPAAPAAPASSTGATPEQIRQVISQIEELIKIIQSLSRAAEATTARPADASAPGAGRESYPTTGTVQVNTSLNVRTSPWGSIIGSLRMGNEVRILGKQGDWFKISHNGQTAYVHRNYVNAPGHPAGRTPVVRPAAPSAPANTAANSSPAPVSTGQGRFGAAPCTPMPSRASSEFGWRTHPTLGTRRHHNGIDLPVPNGTRLNALGDGVVTAVGFESGGGKFIKVRYDNGLESFYCHLQTATVRQGQRVSMGQEIAKADNTGTYTTGAHLHMEVRRNGTPINPRSVLRLP